MKRSLLIAFSALCGISLAQPVMQNIMPIGFSCILSFGAATSPGAGGANQTWNLSGVAATPSATMTVVNPGSTPCGSSFPSANWAQDISGAQFNYYNSTGSQLEVIAEQIPGSCSGGITYSNPKTVLQFPFSYTNSFTDTYVSTAPGTVTTTYDGYGTLITPSGTYSNVARVTFTDGGGTSYEWFDTGAWGHPLALIVGSSTIFFTNPSVGIAENVSGQQIEIYPNPSAGELTLALENNDQYDLSIFGLDGRLVHSQNIQGTTSLDLRELAAGFYTISIKGARGVQIKKLSITH